MAGSCARLRMIRNLSSEKLPLLPCMRQWDSSHETSSISKLQEKTENANNGTDGWEKRHLEKSTTSDPSINLGACVIFPLSNFKSTCLLSSWSRWPQQESFMSIECSALPCFVVSVDLHHVAPMLSRVVCSCHMFLHVSIFYGCTVFPLRSFTLVDMCGCLQECF